MRPIIGVIPLLDMEKESYWMLPGYMQGVEAAGGLPIMLPLTTDRDELAELSGRLDGLLLTGGQDVNPALYRTPVSPLCGKIVPERDTMEALLLDMMLQADKPVLGICRGIQLLNACCGGTLYQDLPTEHPSELVHNQKPPYDVPVHQVTLTPGEPLAALLQTETLAVNSYHHQAVKETAPGLKVMAVATDGLVEAVYMPQQKFVWAVQWHPEFSYKVDQASRRIFAAFVQAAK